LPQAEDVADAFALIGYLGDGDFREGPEHLESLIRAKVPLDDRGWREHRVPRLASKVWRLRQRDRRDSARG
jgi:hypothetical protein